MKAFAYLVIFIVTSFILPWRQDFATSQTAYQDYLYQHDQYRLKLNNFKVARTEYLKYKTLLAETTALDTVKAMISQRDQLLRTYLLLLTEKMNENSGLTNTDKQLYQTLIQNENTFLQNHIALISSIGSLTDATNVSKELESHYLILSASMRQTITALSLGELSKLNTQYSTLFEALRNLVSANKGTVSAEKQSTIDRWMLQINNKQNLYEQKAEQILLASGQLKSVSEQELDASSLEIQKKLGEAKQYLSEGTSYMQELMNLLRYQE